MIKLEQDGRKRGVLLDFVLACGKQVSQDFSNFLNMLGGNVNDVILDIEECINKCGYLTDRPDSNKCETCREVDQ